VGCHYQDYKGCDDVRGVVFDIEGKYAHFRKIYTNSSSLSYTVPPRTTIQGIIAAILGYERDSYYSCMDSSLYISVRKNSSTYKMTQTLNYIRAESASDFTKPKNHTQIPFEVITSKQNVSYRIYVGGDEFSDMHTLIERLKSERYVFPPTLGTAFFLADITFVSEVQFEKCESYTFIPISSVVKAKAVEDIKLEEMSLLKEKMPRAFGENRILKLMESYFIEDNCGNITVKLKKEFPYWKVNYGQKEEFIVFM